MTLVPKSAGAILYAAEYNEIIGRMPTYDAIVYQDATTTYAVDKNGTVLSSGLISAATDDVQIKAAIAYLDALNASVLYGGHLHIGTGTYKISTELTVVKPHTITGSSPTSTVLQTTVAITLFNVNPATSIWEYERFTLRDLKLDGNRVGLYGVTFGSVASSNQKVVKSNFDNLYIEKFANYGVYDNCNWGSVYHNVWFKYNGIATVPPVAINIDSGGICITSNKNTFTGCSFDWNTCGIVLKGGYGSSFFGVGVEGSVYHGIYAYSNVGLSMYPQHNSFFGLMFELNGTHNDSYPASPENLYDAYIVDGDAAYFYFQNVHQIGTYVTDSILCAGNSSFVKQYRSMSTKGYTFSGTYSGGDELSGAAATHADGNGIWHNLGKTPTWATATCSIAGEIASVTAMTSSTITVAIKKHDGSAGTTQTIYWRCGI